MLCTLSKQVWPKDGQESDNGFVIMQYICNESSFENPEAVNQFGDDLNGEAFYARGYFLPTATAIQYDLKGHWEKNTKNSGYTFVVEMCNENVPLNETGIVTFLTSSVKGIGMKTARMIYNEFKEETLNVLDENPDALLKIKGISESKLTKIITSYMSCRGARNVIMALVPQGVSADKAMKIYAKYRDDAYNIVLNEPFKLCYVNGISYDVANRIAQKNGLPMDSPDRCKAAMLEVLRQAEYGGEYFKHTSGHLCIPYAEWLEKSLHLLGFVVNMEQLQKYATELATEGRIKYAMDPESQSPIYYVYKIKLAKAEQEAADALFSLASATNNVNYDVFDEIRLMELKEGFKLAPEQANAVVTGLSNKVAVITGGPGTGKTTIINFIRNIYKKNNPKAKILLCAPTGKAAIRMSESAKAEASTIHRALNILAGDDGEYSEANSLDYDLIIVDETSMLDIYLARTLFKAVKKGAQLILIGDVDQLPSVGPGEVLAEIIASGVIKVAKLIKVYRQDDGSLIALNSYLIKNGNCDLDYDDTFQFIEANSFEEAARTMWNIYMKEQQVVGIDNIMMLTPFRQSTESGVDSLNKIRDSINKADGVKAEIEIKKKLFRVGDKVLQTKNVDNISNGDIGYITKILSPSSREDARVIIDFGFDRIVEYDVYQMETIDWAYATTVHKSQGSEAPVVIFDILDGHSIMLRRNLLYTAITRAKTRVYIVGQKSAINKAISVGVAPEDHRNTLLAKRLRYLNKMHNKCA